MAVCRDARPEVAALHRDGDFGAGSGGRAVPVGIPLGGRDFQPQPEHRELAPQLANAAGTLVKKRKEKNEQ